MESIRAKAIEMSFDSSIERQTKKLSNAIKESQASMYVNLDSHGIFKISENGKRHQKFTGNNLRHGKTKN
jgi:hypothetical protein